MYRRAASLWHAAISGDVASARAPDGSIAVDNIARAIKRSSTAAFPTKGRCGMLARSIEIGHPYFRSKRRAGKSANGSALRAGSDSAAPLHETRGCFNPESCHGRRPPSRQLRATTGLIAVQQKAPSLDHLVGTPEQSDWKGDTKRPGSLEIDDQLDLCGLLHGQVGWLLALKNAAGIDAGQTI
jgi:hypothetical protein